MEERRGVVHSNHVRAGKRSYFFDVMATKDDDYFLCITESRRILDENGRFYFQRQKIFVYKEDFDKFVDGMNATLDFILQQKGEDYGRNEFHGPPRTYPGLDESGQDSGSMTFNDLD